MSRRTLSLAVILTVTLSLVVSATIVHAGNNPPPFLKPTPTKTPPPTKPPAKKPPARKPPARKPVFVMPPGWPKLLSSSQLRIKAPIEAIAFTRKQDVHAPYKWGDVAWYSRGPRPGDPGRANVYGHLDSLCCPAVFYALKKAKPGQLVQVSYRSGKPLTFKILWITSYPNNKLPLKFLYGSTQERGLILMTCTGDFHRDGTGYDRKLVAYARLVLPNGRLG